MIHHTATLRSCTAMLLIAVWALQPLATVLHTREHSHYYCPEHQTFEETARGGGPGKAESSSRTRVLTALRAELAGELGLSAHESCPLLTASPRGEAQPPETATALTSFLFTSLLATAPPGSLCSIPILATAPKGSPPARV